MHVLRALSLVIPVIGLDYQDLLIIQDIGMNLFGILIHKSISNVIWIKRMFAFASQAVEHPSFQLLQELTKSLRNQLSRQLLRHLSPPFIPIWSRTLLIPGQDGHVIATLVLLVRVQQRRLGQQRPSLPQHLIGTLAGEMLVLASRQQHRL